MGYRHTNAPMLDMESQLLRAEISTTYGCYIIWIYILDGEDQSLKNRLKALSSSLQ